MPHIIQYTAEDSGSIPCHKIFQNYLSIYIRDVKAIEISGSCSYTSQELILQASPTTT